MSRWLIVPVIDTLGPVVDSRCHEPFGGSVSELPVSGEFTGLHIDVHAAPNKSFSLADDTDLDECSQNSCLVKPVAIWCSFNLGLTLLAAALVTYLQVRTAHVCNRIYCEVEF